MSKQVFCDDCGELEQLAAHVERLRNIINLHMEGGEPEDYRALSETPAQSLQQHDNEVMIKCLDWIHDELLDNCESLEEARAAIVNETIRTLKAGEGDEKDI